MFSSVGLLALVSALFYCIAMIAMKSWAEIPSLGVALIIASALLVAGTFEVFALRQERLGLIYVGIIGAEVLILAAISLFHFDEAYSSREIAGMALVIVGAVVAWS